MKIIWAILCQNSVTDAETNNISLFNVVEEVQLPAPPPQSLSEAVSRNISPAVLELVVLWVRSNLDSPEKGYGRVKIIQPQDEGIPEETPIGQEFEVALTRFFRVRTRLRLAGLPTRGEGVYLFKIAGKSSGLEWAELFELPVRVVLQPGDSG